MPVASRLKPLPILVFSCCHIWRWVRLKDSTDNMWHKKHRQQDAEAPPGKRLRDNLVDLYASGEVAGDRAQSLLDDAGDFARAMGSDELQDLRGSRSAGSEKNKDRDLRRRLLKRSRWPPIYLAPVRCWSVSQKELIPMRVAVLLPHEVIGVLSEVSDLTVLQQHTALDGTNQDRHTHILQQLGHPFISISLWGDGVPCSWDRKKSVDMWVMSFLGLDHKPYRDIRIVVSCLPHEVVTKGDTRRSICSVGLVIWCPCSWKVPFSSPWTPHLGPQKMQLGERNSQVKASHMLLLWK